MDQVSTLFAHYGYLLLFALGFVEYIGLPIAISAGTSHPSGRHRRSWR